MTISILALGWDSKPKIKSNRINATLISQFELAIEDTGIIAPMISGSLNTKSTSIIQLASMLAGDELEIIPTSSLRKSKKEASLINSDLETFNYLVFRKLIRGEQFVSRTRSPMFYVNDFSGKEVFSCGNADSMESYPEFVQLYLDTIAEARQYMTGNDLKVSLIDPMIRQYNFESLGVGNYTKLLEFTGELNQDPTWIELTKIIEVANEVMSEVTLRPTIISGEFLVLQEEKPFLKGASELIEKVLNASNVGQNNHDRILQASSAIECARKIRSTIESIENIQFDKLEGLLQDAKDHIFSLEQKKAAKKSSNSKNIKTQIISDQAAQIAALEKKLADLMWNLHSASAADSAK